MKHLLGLFLGLAGCGDITGADEARDLLPQTHAYCEVAIVWDSSSEVREVDVIELVNEERSRGASCGGNFYGPAASLALNGALSCAARVHSKDMFDRRFFSHTNPDKESVDARVTRAGYAWRSVGENIAKGQGSPSAVMADWMRSPDHCANIMNQEFTEIGVGHYKDGHWTQVFGAARNNK